MSMTSSASSVSTLSDAALAGYSAKKSSGRAKTGIGFAPVCRVVALLYARRLQGAGVGARQNGKLHGVTICRERSTGQCNTACSLSAGVRKPKVFRGR